jgi:hypothetical protein
MDCSGSGNDASRHSTGSILNPQSLEAALASMRVVQPLSLPPDLSASPHRQTLRHARIIDNSIFLLLPASSIPFAQLSNTSYANIPAMGMSMRRRYFKEYWYGSNKTHRALYVLFGIAQTACVCRTKMSFSQK